MPPTPWFPRSSSSKSHLWSGEVLEMPVVNMRPLKTRDVAVSKACGRTPQPSTFFSFCFKRRRKWKTLVSKCFHDLTLCDKTLPNDPTSIWFPQSTSLGTLIAVESWADEPLIGSFCPICSVNEVRYSKRRIGYLQSCSRPTRLRRVGLGRYCTTLSIILCLIE